MRNAIKTKYSLVRYYYSTMFAISTNQEETGTLFKPMFFEYPDDVEAYSNITYNVMLGDSLKLSINPESLTMTDKDYYFPAGRWCAIAGTHLDECFTSFGQYKSYPAMVDDFQLHIREGKIVPMQNTTDFNFSTTVDLQKQPVELHVLGTSQDDLSWTASGLYYNDDGLTLDYAPRFNKYSFKASSQSGSISLRIDSLVTAT